MTPRIIIGILVSALMIPSLVACAPAATTAGDSTANSESSSVALSDDDIMFAQMMIPHHEQAIEMAQMAASRTPNAKVLSLAKGISDAQKSEVATMKKWLADADAPLMMDHDMGMTGVLSDEQMSALADASGPVFDQLFLESMIAHHEGAIEMARYVTDSANPQVKALADSIIATQTSEIAKMTKMLN